MYSAIEIPLGRERAKGSPASPRDARRLLPTRARQRAGDHCGPKILDPPQTGTPASPSQTGSVTQTCQRPRNRPAGWTSADAAGRSAHGQRHERVFPRPAVNKYAGWVAGHRCKPERVGGDDELAHRLRGQQRRCGYQHLDAEHWLGTYSAGAAAPYQPVTVSNPASTSTTRAWPPFGTPRDGTVQLVTTVQKNIRSVRSRSAADGAMQLHGVVVGYLT